GVTLTPITGSANVTVQIGNAGTQGADQVFSTEMLSLDLIGPGGIRLRESPTRPSLGQVRMQQTASGYSIGSFFDIFTELSTDGGQTWMQTDTPAHVELQNDAATAQTQITQINAAGGQPSEARHA